MTNLVALPKPRFTSRETDTIGPQIMGAMAGLGPGDAADQVISRWHRLVQITIANQEETPEALFFFFFFPLFFFFFFFFFFFTGNANLPPYIRAIPTYDKVGGHLCGNDFNRC